MNTYRTIIGIDPGINGGVTIIHDGIPKVFDVPTKIEEKAKKKKRVFDKEAMAALFRPYAGKDTLVCLELVHAMPGNGNVSMFGFGRGFGVWEGIIAAFEMGLDIIPPQRWKKTWTVELMKSVEKPDGLDLTKEEIKKLSKTKKQEYDDLKKDFDQKKAKAKEEAKDSARLLAAKLYPHLAEMFKLKKHDGRAESLLIAEHKRLEILNVK